MQAVLLSLLLATQPPPAGLEAQDQGAPQVQDQGEPVVLRLHDVPLAEAAHAILPAGSLAFVIERELASRVVTVEAAGLPWDQVLHSLLEDEDVEHVLSGSRLLLLPRERAGRRVPVGCMEDVLVAEPSDPGLVDVVLRLDALGFAASLAVSSKRELVLDFVGEDHAVRLIREDLRGTPRVRVTVESGHTSDVATLADGGSHDGSLGGIAVEIRPAVTVRRAAERERHWQDVRRRHLGR